MLVIPFISFKDDVCDIKVEVTELFARPGRNDSSLVYIMPPKILALEQGDGARFLRETSFSSVDTEALPPPPSPINCEMQEIQSKVNSLETKVTQTNRNIVLFGSFFLVLMTAFLSAGIICLMVGLKVPILMQFIEEISWAIGLEN